jgi:hypothetical protein
LNGQFYATTGKKNSFASQKSKKKNKFPCNLYIDLPCKLAVDLKIFVFKIFCCGTCWRLSWYYNKNVWMITNWRYNCLDFIHGIYPYRLKAEHIRSLVWKSDLQQVYMANQCTNYMEIYFFSYFSVKQNYFFYQ